MVEVLSPSTEEHDRGVKRKLYAAHGVPSYWLVDPAVRRAEGYVLAAGDYRQVSVAEGEGMFSAPPFSDLEIALAQVWA